MSCNLFAKQLNKTGLNVKMDPDGLVPNVGATVQKQAEYGMSLARKAIKDNPSKISDKQRKDFKGADNYLKSGKWKSYFKNGIVIAHEGVLIDNKELIHASSKQLKTVKVDFLDYINNNGDSKFDGIMFYKFHSLSR